MKITRQYQGIYRLKSMLMIIDVGDKMCWWQLWDVGDGLAVLIIKILYIPKIPPISKFCRKQSKVVTSIKSVTSTCHQHPCSRIYILISGSKLRNSSIIDTIRIFVNILDFFARWVRKCQTFDLGSKMSENSIDVNMAKWATVMLVTFWCWWLTVGDNFRM